MALEELLAGIPRINWPTFSGEYKVVQINLLEKPYLLFASDKNQIHVELLLNLFISRNIPYTEILGERGSMVPTPKGSDYVVRGMGFCDVNVKNKQAAFYGKSADYGLGINEEHLHSISGLAPEWRMGIRIIKWL